MNRKWCEYIKYTCNSILQTLEFITIIYWKLVLKTQLLSDEFGIQKLLYWQHNAIIYYWTEKVSKSFDLFNWE